MSFYNSHVYPSSPTYTSRLDYFQAQDELARNFYDDDIFCPIQCSKETSENRERVEQRCSPNPSPRSSPVSSHRSSPSSRAIPIINPSNMAPVSVPSRHWGGGVVAYTPGQIPSYPMDVPYYHYS